MPERLIRLFLERVSINTRRGGSCMCNRVKPGWKTEGVIMNIECEESFTPRDVYSSILQAHGGFINTEPFTIESYESNFERTCKQSYQQNYESNESSGKTTGNINSKTDQFIISNQNTLEAKQDKTQLEGLPDGNRSHGKLQKRRSRSKVHSY